MPKKALDPSSNVEPDAATVPVTVPGPTLTGGPSGSWQGGLYQRVINAVFALPSHFRSSLDIKGIRATDLYTLNSALGAAIEQSVVDNLNAIRAVWDPNDEFQSYAFVRQAQAFPDVRLQTDSPSVAPRILMGIELKGWFALAKEGEPSFRYLVTPNACADADLLVVFPWLLDEIVSGTPRLLRPFVTEARYAAEERNHYWQVKRDVTGQGSQINLATHQTPYPVKADQANDLAIQDTGNNFGRVARSGLMAAFISSMMNLPAAGIPLGAWQRFIKIFADGKSAENIRSGLKQIAKTFPYLTNRPAQSKEAVDSLVKSLEELIGIAAASESSGSI